MSIEWVLPKTRSSSWFDISCLGGLARSPEITHPWGPKKPDKVVLYLHGGAYLLCTPASLRGITFSLAGGLKAPLCAVDYRRPPEYPIPAPMDDAIAAYRNLLEIFPGTDIILAGDSAGGGIAAAMLCKLREINLPMPRCCILISPWTDLGVDGLRHATMENEASDFLPGSKLKKATDIHDDNYHQSTYCKKVCRPHFFFAKHPCTCNGKIRTSKEPFSK